MPDEQKRLFVPEEEHGYKLDAEEHEEDVPEVEAWQTCFMIGIDAQGVAHASAEPDKFVSDKGFARKATANDFWLGAAQVARDLEEINTAQRVMINMQMFAQSMQEQVEAQAMANKLDLPGNPMNRAQRRAR